MVRGQYSWNTCAQTGAVLLENCEQIIADYENQTVIPSTSTTKTATESAPQRSVPQKRSNMDIYDEIEASGFEESTVVPVVKKQKTTRGKTCGNIPETMKLTSFSLQVNRIIIRPRRVCGRKVIRKADHHLFPSAG